jgi:hypothetical protein
MICCFYCETEYPIEPLTEEETSLFRVMNTRLGSINKIYFCDLLCYFKLVYSNVDNPTGYHPLTKTQREYYLQLQESHPQWRYIKWLTRS